MQSILGKGEVDMDRDELLALAREKRTANEEYENHLLYRSEFLASMLGTALGIIIAVIEVCVTKKGNFGIMTVLFSADAFQLIYQGCRLHKKFYVVAGIWMAILAVVTMLAFIGTMVIA